MSKTHDHEIVSIYPFTEEEVDHLMTHSNECVLMWATKDGWPVGVTHAFVWHEGKVWLTFLGGGAFGNDRRWIADAIARAHPPQQQDRYCRQQPPQQVVAW